MSAESFYNSNISLVINFKDTCCCKGSWSMVTCSVRHQGTHYGDIYTWITWQQKIQKNYGFFSQKVVTTGGVFDRCELCYSSLIHFQEHCFPCPLFQTTQPRTHIVTLSAFIARHELFNPLNFNAAVKVLDQWLPIAGGFKAHITGICILELFDNKKSKKTMDFFRKRWSQQRVYLTCVNFAPFSRPPSQDSNPHRYIVSLHC